MDMTELRRSAEQTTRAWSKLEVKEVDEAKGIIRGIATTPSTDRMGDVIESEGAQFSLPLPLLWQHKHDSPIGEVIEAVATSKGIRIVAQVALGVTEDIDTAWKKIKARLVKGLSIGFRPIEYQFMDNGGIRFVKWDWYELSAVTVPANADCSITTIKSIDQSQQAVDGEMRRDTSASNHSDAAATGTKRGAIVRAFDTTPGVTGSHKNGKPTKEKPMATIAENIKAFEAKRAAHVARMTEIMEGAADEGSTLDDAQAEEHDNLQSDVDSIDKHLTRLRKLYEQAAREATPITGVKNQQTGSDLRSGIIKIKRELPKGTAFTRYAMALAAGRGSVADAMEYFRSRAAWSDETPEVADLIKAAAGTTQEGNWAAPFVDPGNAVGEFLEMLMPKTVIGRLTGVQKVPFNIKMLVQTGGSTFQWVGETKPKPVGEMSLSQIILPAHKIAGIVVLSDELVRDSRPSAEEKVRNDLIRQGVKFLDTQFLDPAITATADRPASITNGITAITPNGTTADALYYDLGQMLSPLYDADAEVDQLSLVMRPGMAGRIGLLRNALGQFEFGTVNARGGELSGLKVITSNSAPAGAIVAISESEILMADDGAMRLDASREATLDMNGGNAPDFSLFQRNAVAIRAERGISWMRSRPTAVAMIAGGAYGPADPTP